jgi:hypothetical protein
VVGSAGELVVEPGLDVVGVEYDDCVTEPMLALEVELVKILEVTEEVAFVTTDVWLLEE